MKLDFKSIGIIVLVLGIIIGGTIMEKRNRRLANEGLKFLDKLNFKESFTVSKERTLYKYKGFSVCLDRVEHLGNFIEIEKLISKEEDKEKTKDECLELLQSLGLDYKIENRKYGDLMQEIINNKKG